MSMVVIHDIRVDAYVCTILYLPCCLYSFH